MRVRAKDVSLSVWLSSDAISVPTVRPFASSGPLTGNSRRFHGSGAAGRRLGGATGHVILCETKWLK